MPPFFLADVFPERDFQEWMDAYWSKDIQELFRIEKRYSFQKFAELIWSQSGGIFEATKFARHCEVSRTTIANYLSVLEATFVAYVIRPFSAHHPTEITSAPKVYGFDTGFVCYYKGWNQLRESDKGVLWEHFVLNEMLAHLQAKAIRYWRNKRGQEVDFVALDKNKEPMLLECKWNADTFTPQSAQAFRKRYPYGRNFVVSYDVDRPFSKRYNDILVEFIRIDSLGSIFSASRF